MGRLYSRAVFHPNGRQLVYIANGNDRAGFDDWALENFLPKTPK